jgi:hypothetical protein
MAAATLLLPEHGRLSGTMLTDKVARALARADRRDQAAGEHAQLLRHFELDPVGLPVAALTRQLDAGDAGSACWVRAEPAYVAPDVQGVRMLGYGDLLAPDAADVAALLPDLQPLFNDVGYVLDAPVPARWYLRLPAEAQLPEFTAPQGVLGDDLFDHLPQGEHGRRWRALLTEAQVLLHQHPWNHQRIAQGKSAINSLWFWGGGIAARRVHSPHGQVRSREPLLLALAAASGMVDEAQPHEVDALVDLRHLRSLDQFCSEVLQPLLAALGRGELDQLTLDFQDGQRYDLQPRQRWRLWRGALKQLGQ